MKTKISITGQPMSVTTLANALEGTIIKECGTTYIEFSSRKEARKAIKEAYLYLKEDDKTCRKSKENSSLRFDAGYATILF